MSVGTLLFILGIWLSVSVLVMVGAAIFIVSRLLRMRREAKQQADATERARRRGARLTDHRFKRDGRND